MRPATAPSGGGRKFRRAVVYFGFVLRPFDECVIGSQRRPRCPLAVQFKETLPPATEPLDDLGPRLAQLDNEKSRTALANLVAMGHCSAMKHRAERLTMHRCIADGFRVETSK